MEQVVVRRLKDGTLADYRRAAEASGRSLEAELRDVIERNRPVPVKDTAQLLELSKRLCAMTLKPGGDSTLYIRQMRDAGYGGSGVPDNREDDAGR
ncbi:MAG TPA: hypothetical protein VF680_10880 [Allosphingosinicella sp.]|jgi:plasmid stability protein